MVVNKVKMISNFCDYNTNINLTACNLYIIRGEYEGKVRLFLQNYNTTIAYKDLGSDYIFINECKYSRTTSKNQGYLKRYAREYQEYSPKDYMRGI